jgi:hypothetical protein
MGDGNAVQGWFFGQLRGPNSSKPKKIISHERIAKFTPPI